jgi:7-carboxy-7-deazaguanine synthase
MTHSLKTGVKMKLYLNSIYLATEGEGIHVGIPQVFVRYQGCNIGCLNCDSKDTWEFKDEMGLDFQGVLAEINTVSLKQKIKRVSITGGDPLHPMFEESLLALVQALKKDDFYVNIEASGQRISHKIFDLIDYISFDFKTPCTGVKGQLNLIQKLSEQYPNKFQIKSVVESREDFDYLILQKERLENTDFPWVITPSYNLNEEFPKERFNQIVGWNEGIAFPFRVIAQQHKLLHGPDKKQI